MIGQEMSIEDPHDMICSSSLSRREKSKVEEDAKHDSGEPLPQIHEPETNPLGKPENPSLIEEIIYSTMEEGINPRIQLVIHFIFFVLFFTLLGLFVVSSFNLHVLTLMAIEIGLWGSVTWVLIELQHVEHVEKIPKEANTKSSKSD